MTSSCISKISEESSLIFSTAVKTLQIDIFKIKMSDYITFEIQEEIIKRLPVRSLVRCRSVSKTWKGLIDSPEFITAYSLRQTQPQHLLISYQDTGAEKKYVSFVDNDAFPQQRYALTLPLSIKHLHYSRVVGSSGGLLCFYGYNPPPVHLGSMGGERMAVLWNPSIKKSVAIDVPLNDGSDVTVLGFGVCPVTSDPKIVYITHRMTRWEVKVKVYTLSSGEWSTTSFNPPHHRFLFTWDQIVIDRFIYWLARVMIGDQPYTIMSFDITNLEFREVCLPHIIDRLTASLTSKVKVSISKVWESLVVLEYSTEADKRICVVRMMEHGVPKSFSKLFTIKTPHASIETLGFRKNGEPIMKTLDGLNIFNAEAALVVYEPYSEHINDIGISGKSCSLSVNSYMETLLLLNQRDCDICFDID